VSALRSKSGPKGVDWDRVILDRARGLSIAQLAAKYDVAERTVKARRAADAKAGWPWPPPRGGAGVDTPDVRFASGALRVLDGGMRAIFRQDPGFADSTGGSAFIDGAPVDDEQLVVALRHAAHVMLRALMAGKIRPGMHQGVADVYFRVVSAVGMTIDLSRLVAGRAKGEPSGAAGGGPSYVFKRYLIDGSTRATVARKSA
jgi:hypothetical protein